MIILTKRSLYYFTLTDTKSLYRVFPFICGLRDNIMLDLMMIKGDLIESDKKITIQDILVPMPA